MIKVFLGLGSNVGDKIENIKRVYDYFASDELFTELSISSLYETEPFGDIEQDNFINAAISFYTNLSLENLFKLTKNLEKEIGRIKRVNWGPREIDIDILLYGNIIFENEYLTIPHKGLLNRDFVIAPLVELDENIEHPIKKKKIKSFLSKLEDKYIIDKINCNFTEQNLAGQKISD